MTHPDKAEKLFLSGYNCSQSVFAAFCDVTGMDETAALKLSSSFGGGIGRMRGICGACTGMYMAVGLLYGCSDPNDGDAKSAHYALIQRMTAMFRERFGTVSCRELLGDTGNDSSPVSPPRDRKFYESRPCLACIRAAAEITDQIITGRRRKLKIEN